MDVTVTVPTLNEEHYLPTCLDCIQESISACDDGYDFEVVVVDSQSDDRTVEIAEDHDVVDRVLQAERGILKARDTGIREADGDIVVCVDADTTYPERFLTALLGPFEEQDLSITYGPAYGQRTEFHIDSFIRRILQSLLPKIGLCWVSGSNRAIRRSDYVELGGYDLSKDSDSVLRVMREEQVRFPLALKDKSGMEYVPDAASYQSHRTVDQLLLLDRKVGGRSWNVINFYDHIVGLGSRLKSAVRKNS